MEPADAREIAVASHGSDVDRFGEPVFDHLARVAAMVPLEARAIAWLHDLFEWSDVGGDELRARGLTSVEASTLELLTRARSELYMGYTLRIAHATGEAGRLARIVKLADLDDHLGRGWTPPNAPPYMWARARIVAAQSRKGESRRLSIPAAPVRPGAIPAA